MREVRNKLLINTFILLPSVLTNLIHFQYKILRYARSMGTIIIFCCLVSVIKDYVEIGQLDKKSKKDNSHWFNGIVIGFMLTTLPAFVDTFIKIFFMHYPIP